MWNVVQIVIRFLAALRDFIVSIKISSKYYFFFDEFKSNADTDK